MGVHISIGSLQLLTMSSDWFPKYISVLESGIPVFPDNILTSTRMRT